MKNAAKRLKLLYIDAEASSAIRFLEDMSSTFEIIQTNNTKKANAMLTTFSPDVVLLNLCGQTIEKGLDFIEATAAQLMPQKVVFGIIVGGTNYEVLQKAELCHKTLVFTPITLKKTIVNNIIAKHKNEILSNSANAVSVSVET